MNEDGVGHDAEAMESRHFDEFLTSLRQERDHVDQLIKQDAEKSSNFPTYIERFHRDIAAQIVLNKYTQEIDTMAADLSEMSELASAIRNSMNNVVDENSNVVALAKRQAAQRRRRYERQLPVTERFRNTNISHNIRVEIGSLISLYDEQALRDVYRRALIESQNDLDLDMVSSRLSGIGPSEELRKYLKDEVDEVDVKIGKMANRMVLVDIRQDEDLKHFFEGQEYKEFVSHVPSAEAKFEEEVTFLKKLKGLTRKQLEDEASSFASTLDRLEALSEKKPLEGSENFLIPSEYGFLPAHKLGDAMRRKLGVCIHHSLLNKVVLDSLENCAVETSFKSGFIRSHPGILRLGSGRMMQAHTWNTVTFPTGRKYLLDSDIGFILRISERDATNAKRACVDENPEIELLKTLYVNPEQMEKRGEDIASLYPLLTKGL